MSDKIHIRNLALRCIIGVFPEERRAKQDVIINILMDCNFGDAAATDHLEDTVDYKTINKEIIQLVEQSEYNLIETMAEQISTVCLGHEHVSSVTVSVDKPGALRFAESVAVEITRSR